jgi:addiction module HigA family antidote
MVRKLNVPGTRIERIVAEETGIAPDTTLRLGKFFNTTAQFWLNFQQAYELETLGKSMAADLAKITPMAA